MRRYVVLAVLVTVAASCDKDPFVGPVDGPAATVIVYGQVTGANGAALPSIMMAIEARTQGSCANPRIDAVTVTTDDNGAYHATLFNWGTEYTVCVNVQAIPASGSGLAADSLQQAPVIMRSEHPDSIRMDLVLEPSA